MFHLHNEHRTLLFPLWLNYQLLFFTPRLIIDLRALAFNFIDLDNRKVFKDKKKLQVIKELRKDAVILKPDKGNGVVVIDTTDYYESLNKLFSDTTKFKRLDTDPTNTRLNILQLTFESHIIETKFQKKSIRKSDQKVYNGKKHPRSSPRTFLS